MKLDLEDTLPDALAEALGQVVANCKKQWEQELELMRAERRALIAEIKLAAIGQPSPQPEPAPTAPQAAKPKGARS